MPKSIEYLTLSYLNAWLDHDLIYCEALTSKSDDKKLQGISKAAQHYKVARNLPTRFDVDKGLKRYEPVLKVLDNIKATDFSTDDVESITEVEKNISNAYGGRGALSFTTKLLWIKMPGNVIIYDRRARNALGTAEDDLKAYYKAWRAEYKIQKNEIDRACKELRAIAMYASNQAIASSTYIQKISAKPWFKERVFDTMLWDRGRP
jgi:hypothetical protein